VKLRVELRSHHPPLHCLEASWSGLNGAASDSLTKLPSKLLYRMGVLLRRRIIRDGIRYLAFAARVLIRLLKA
jgi:hypothetical protein